MCPGKLIVILILTLSGKIPSRKTYAAHCRSEIHIAIDELSTFADSRYAHLDSWVDVAEGTLSTAVERFEGHHRSDLEQVADTGSTA